MKTSNAYFNRFKKEFVRWQQKLGLTQYRIDFFHELLKEPDGSSCYAKIEIFEKDKFAKVGMATEIENLAVDLGPESHARHEVIHLFIHRLQWLAESRFSLNQTDIEEEVEAIVVRLEKVLK